MFAIITSELDGPTEHYLGEDDALWDWLHADNLEPVSGGSLYRLQAPAGYVFYHGNLISTEDSAGYDGGGRDYDFVSLGSGKEAKALMLLLSLRSVSPEVLTEMGLGENRTLEVETY